MILSIKESGQQMTEESLELLADAHLAGQSVDRYTDTILAAIRNDPHNPSTRPCPTCREITAMIGKPFWCYRVALEASGLAKKKLPEKS